MSKQRIANHTAEGGSLVLHNQTKLTKAMEYALKLSTQIQQREELAAQYALLSSTMTSHFFYNSYPD